MRLAEASHEVDDDEYYFVAGHGICWIHHKRHFHVIVLSSPLLIFLLSDLTQVNHCT
jgi:hypothetical protein